MLRQYGDLRYVEAAACYRRMGNGDGETDEIRSVERSDRKAARRRRQFVQARGGVLDRPILVPWGFGVDPDDDVRALQPVIGSELSKADCH
jgi:hypothetical protein